MTREIDIGEVSDGYHTFNELYDHRFALYGALIKSYGGWKSLRHYDPDFPMYDGWFIAGVELPGGSITYHLPIKYWESFPGKEVDRPHSYDGHTSQDVIDRLTKYWQD